jgi:integrase
MPYAELPRFMNILSDRTALSARALELTILTCARTNEILKSTWSEYDLEESNWVVAPNRMKAKREHRVPLSAKAVSILNILNKTQTGEFVFPGRELSQSLSEMSMLMLLRRMNIQNTTVHGFRSSFRDWCFEQTSYPREVAEMALSHKVGSDVELAYRRSDALQQRRQLMNDWADFCYSQTNKPEI